MPRSAAYRTTFYLLEAMVVLLLAESALHSSAPLAVACLALVVGGLFWNRARQASWFVMVLIAFVELTIHPTQMDGYVLGLAGVYILFNSGLWGDRPFFPGVIVLTLTAACQFAGLILAWDQWQSTLTHVVMADVIVVTLVVVYRKQLMGIEPHAPRPLPVLDLVERGLNSTEMEVLRLYANGRCSKEIAADLSRSDHAIRTALSQIYRKLAVAGGKELLILLHTHRLVFSKE